MECLTKTKGNRIGLTPNSMCFASPHFGLTTGQNNSMHGGGAVQPRCLKTIHEGILCQVAFNAGSNPARAIQPRMRTWNH